MTFWVGFLCGFIASYVLAVAVMVGIVLFSRRGAGHGGALLSFGDCNLNDDEEYLPAPPPVPFTHVTNLGSEVHGRDD